MFSNNRVDKVRYSTTATNLRGNLVDDNQNEHSPGTGQLTGERDDDEERHDIKMANRNR